MIIYDYVCPSCGDHTERLVTHVNDEQFCYHCGHKMDKLLSSPAMVKTNHADKTGFRKK